MNRPVSDLFFIDSHAHLDARAFDPDRTDVLTRAWDAGLRAIVTIGVQDSLEGIERAVAVASENERVFATVGFHPHDAARLRPGLLKRIEELTAHPNVVGVGETGLDYHYMHSPVEVQREAFRSFLRLARRVDLPVVVHTREADGDTLEILREAVSESGGGVCGVVHCFSGDYALAKACLDMGLDLSFTGVITFPGAGGLREVVKRVPLERILVETDCPYLAPVPFRGRRNEPAFVVTVAETVAEVLGRSLEDVARATGENAARLFRLPVETVRSR